MMKRFLSLSVLIAMLWGCCNAEDTPATEKKSDNTNQTYSVTYKSEYGTAPSKISGLKKDEELTKSQLQELVTTGYTFAGWYNGENEITTGHKITCDLELTAKWDVNTYTVIFNANGGSGNMEYQGFTYNAEQALNANAFTREGYTFAGWATATDGNATYTDAQKVSNLTAENNAILTLYAVWTDNDKVSPVIFSQPTAVDYGESVTLSCATEGAKISYTIDGVTAEYTDAFPITKDVIITAFATKDGMKDSDTSIASYTVKTYRVTYRSEYGTEPDKITGLKKGDTLTEEQLAGITAGGYTFSGWYNGENKIEAGYTITCDLELTAKWDANTYTVKFDANGGSGEMTSQTFTYDVEQALTANTFTRDGYTFAGWATSIDGEKIYEDCARVIKLATTANAEVILYAQWKTVTYTITYNLNGGINAENNPADYNTETDTITLSDATQKEGYTFGGWYTDDTFDETRKIVQIAKGTLGDITLYAKWNANTYTVKFDANGGSGSMDSQTFTYDVEQTLTAIGFARKDYTFAGWAKSTNGEIIYSNKGSVKNLTAEIDGEVTLYAIWNEAGLVYVQGATITGAITADGYTTSDIFKDGGTVTVGNFYMCDHEVTQAEYETYCSYGGTMKPSETKGVGDNYPVYHVSWYDVLVYCNIRSIKEGLTPCYTIKGSTDPEYWGTVPTSSNGIWNAVTCNFEANGYRLPTEAEWEYAARGGNGLSDYQYKYAGSDRISDVAWYLDNSGSKTHEVKSKKANGLGLYDMSGNMWEWCWDFRGSDYRYKRGGGGWDYSESDWTVSDRSSSSNAYGRGNNIGFRVVRTAE